MKDEVQGRIASDVTRASSHQVVGGALPIAPPYTHPPAPAVGAEDVALLIFNDRLKRRGLSPVTMNGVEASKRNGHSILYLDLPVANAILSLLSGQGGGK